MHRSVKIVDSLLCTCIHPVLHLLFLWCRMRAAKAKYSERNGSKHSPNLPAHNFFVNTNLCTAVFPEYIKFATDLNYILFNFIMQLFPALWRRNYTYTSPSPCCYFDSPNERIGIGHMWYPLRYIYFLPINWPIRLELKSGVSNSVDFLLLSKV
jgi:hypothetical protein